jgi:hypothetical protein
MKKKKVSVQFVVYAPPEAGFPFLAARLDHQGDLTVTPFASAAQAQAHNQRQADQLQGMIDGKS